MIEKVNPMHPDKLADRIAGAIVDLAYKKNNRPKIAVEVLIGHGLCTVIIESSEKFLEKEIQPIVNRIAGNQKLKLLSVEQDKHLANNQEDKIRCGDNGIFRGIPLTSEEKELSKIARELYEKYLHDGKYILDGDRLIICQSNAVTSDLKALYPHAEINPLGFWTGGTNVDTGCTNRKLGSDMAQSVTGGGLCLSGDTEYIGEDLRWHRIDEYTCGKVGQWNNGVLEFIEPTKYIHNKDDSFIMFKNNTKLSMKLTHNHDILIKTSKGNLIKHKASKIANKLSNRIGNMGSIIHDFTYENNIKHSKFKNKNEYILQVAFCADGSFTKYKNSWKGRIRVKKDRKKEYLKKILVDIPHKVSEDGDYKIYWFNPTILSKSLYECFKDENWDLLKEEVMLWDGDYSRKIFRSVNKQDVDFIQFVWGSYGIVSTILTDDRVGQSYGSESQYTRKSIGYSVSMLQSTTTGLRENKGSSIDVSYLDKKEDSYCFTVPSSNLVVRHNDRIFVTGNCGKELSKADVSINIYAFLKAQKTGKIVELSCAIGDELVDGKPYHEIVEIAKEYIDALGGFEKFAEWGLF